MSQSPLTARRWYPDPTPADFTQFSARIRRRQRLAVLTGVMLCVGIVGLGLVVWYKLPVLGLILGVNLVLVFAVGILDQLWRRCPRCDYSLVPNIVRIEIDDSPECPRCALDLTLLRPMPF